VRDTVIASIDGRIVRIRDVAEVSWNTAAYSYTGRYNGKRAVFVTANQKDGYNILQVREHVMAEIAHIREGLPKRVSLEVGFDQSQNVRHRLNRLYGDFGIAIALVLLTLLPLGWRAAGIVMISIPLSLSFGLACLYFLDYSLNQLSIAGFVVALGLLVDDSIVVVENIARHMRMGYSRVQAALAGTKQIFVAILGCTATLIFAFLPLLALPRHAGQVHPRAAHGGGLHHHRFAVTGSLHHSLPHEPRAEREIAVARESIPEARDECHPQLLPPGAALVPGAPEIHGGGGARRIAGAVRVARVRPGIEPVPQGGYAAVPDPG
jgi:hypothetical protein